MFKGTWKYVHYYTNMPDSPHLLVLTHVKELCHSVPTKSMPDSARFHTNPEVQIPQTSFCSSTGVASLQPWEQEVPPVTIVEERPSIASGCPERRANWSWGSRQKDRGMDVRMSPLWSILHLILHEGSLPHLVMLGSPMSLKGWHLPIWNWFLNTVLFSGVRARPLIIHPFSVWIPVSLTWNLSFLVCREWSHN